MAQPNYINIGTAPNDGLGDSIRTSFGLSNDWFSFLNNRAQPSPPATLTGTIGDEAGMYAYDSTYFYYCFANYDGSSIIWAQVTQVANVAVTSINSGTSNVKIVGSNGDATVNINGSSNIAAFRSTGTYVTGVVSATGNITGNYILGNGSQLTGLPATYSNTNVSSFMATFGSNTISTTGSITSGNVTSGNVLTGGLISAVGNVTGNYILGNGSQLTGLPATYSNTNVSSFMAAFGSNIISTTGSITSGNVTGGNILTGGLISATGNVSSGNLIVVNNINAGNTISATAHTGTSVSVTGNITGGNISATNHTGTNVSVTGNIIGGNVLGGANVNATTHTGTSVSVTGTVTSASTVGGIITGSSVSVTGAVTGASTVGGVITGTSVSVSGAVTGASTVGGVITGSSASLSGNVTGANFITAGTITVNSNNNDTAIANGGSNSVGNIGSSTNYFNTVYATATTALYADVAECYTADAEYAPGTVVCFDGLAEVTQCNTDACATVAGIISTNPAYKMNSGLASEYVAVVALTGRVPTKVKGPVKKGAMLVSAGNGYARAEIAPAIGTVLGKAVESFDGDTGTIEVVVGRI